VSAHRVDWTMVGANKTRSRPPATMPVSRLGKAAAGKPEQAQGGKTDAGAGQAQAQKATAEVWTVP
jgi:hypothetical protein